MSNQVNILVTGANGQLGMEFQQLAAKFPTFHFYFTNRETLDVTNYDAVLQYFNRHDIDYCINCAAYTAVDKAETERTEAMDGNAEAAGYLAEACTKHGARMMHFSTDYVFNGQSSRPYRETDPEQPINYYGETKLSGEHLVQQYNTESIIIRTSWVYSKYGKNFVKTMLRLMAEKDAIQVVNDQFGSPTYAADIALAVLQIIEQDIWNPGVYHYCNEGVITWYDFATAIKDEMQFTCTVQPITTDQFPTPAKRPAYSAMDTTLFKTTFPIQIPHWKVSLQQCLQLIRQA